MKKKRETPKASRSGRWLRNRRGQVRLVWLWMAGIIAAGLWSAALEMLFAGGATGGVLACILRATQLTPLWSLPALTGQSALYVALKCAGIALIALGFRRAQAGEASGMRARAAQLPRWTALGVGAALLGIGLALALDSLRTELPLTEPALGGQALLAVPLCFVMALSDTMFLTCFLYDGARQRLGRIPALLLLLPMGFLLMSGWSLSWLGWLNVLLQLLGICLLYERWGLAAPVGFWFGWSYALTALFHPGAQGVWTIYHVSERWLTGGNYGLFNGVWGTLVLAGLCIWAMRPLRWPKPRRNALGNGKK